MTLTMPHYGRRTELGPPQNSSADNAAEKSCAETARSAMRRPLGASSARGSLWPRRGPAKGQRSRWVRRWVAPGAVMDGLTRATIGFHAVARWSLS